MRTPYIVDCLHRFIGASSPEGIPRLMLPGNGGVVAWLSPQNVRDIERYSLSALREIRADGSIGPRKEEWPSAVPVPASPSRESVEEAVALLCSRRGSGFASDALASRSLTVNAEERAEPAGAKPAPSTPPPGASSPAKRRGRPPKKVK